ncbi:glycosyltransferase family 4 protein [Vibrio breoganii]|uniref:glycosyltransferase family 4 protein n=1 Tax=Vibrio breoganii TaxID=553239 RepID=UPI000C81A367|nr:glycosyltransferase family 4 protein [Vibrio breoganii]PML12522.1 hypothetical protein BCT84_15345 [Vibrio breoganii]
MYNKVVKVALEHRFYQYEGSIYTKLSFPYSYWQDYLGFFDKVIIVARVKEVSGIDESYKLVTGDNVKFFSMPYYVGTREFFYNLPRLLYSAHKATKGKEPLLLRSGNIANLVWLYAMLKKLPYLREYPGNIKEGILGYGGTSIVNKILANLLNSFAKIQARYSRANSYVSEYCKNLYPSSNKSYVFSSFNADEIDLKKENFSVGKSIKLISVGRLEGEKGHQDLINALGDLDIPVELTIIGDGTKMPELQKSATDLNVTVRFLGAVTNRALLFGYLADSDIFVIPSHTEGMPRALLEAMAVGLTCIGANVGGIPEVLEKEMLFVPNNPTACGNKIKELASDNDLMRKQSSRNLAFIEDNYSKSALDNRKINFWSELYK